MMPETPPTAADAMRLGRAALPTEDAGSAEAWLLHVLGWERVRLFVDGGRQLDAAQWQRYSAGIERLRQGEPLAYLTGVQGFWAFLLTVSPAVLIPRPDTERLVELAVQRLPVGEPLSVADLGTGSGAIALAIAHERPHAQVVAVERSRAALRIAAANRDALGLDGVKLVQGDWSEGLASGAFDLIASNPPYLADDDPHLQRDGLDHEPRNALVGGSDGLADLRRIIADAPRVLRTGGWLLLEHGHTQGAAVRELLGDAGFLSVETVRDYGDRERVSLGQRPG